MRLLAAPVSSVWFGLTMLLLLLVYMSVGSAIPTFRQDPRFEMTEFEWFHTPVFLALILLVCLTLASVTIRRIPLKVMNLGVWMIHVGVVSLCLSSSYYFLTKVEGDTPVIRRSLAIQTPDGSIGNLAALPGASIRVGSMGFTVSSIEPAWPILSGEDEGETALSINVAVDAGESQFIRQVLVGYPQYTEDIIPGQGRAIKAIGQRLLMPQLHIAPEYLPQEWFYLKDSRALYARNVGDDGTRGQWQMHTLPGLPRYNDVVADASQVRSQATNTRVIQRDLAIAPEAQSQADIFTGHNVRVHGFLRYAFLQSDFHPGARSVSIRLPELNISVDVDEAQTLQFDQDLAFTPIAQTGYSYRLAMFADDFVFPDGRVLPLVGVDFKTPTSEFTRLQSSDASIVFDFPLGQFDLENTLPTDESVVIAYDHNGHVDRIPAIVPRRQRDRDAGELFSMIEVSIGQGGDGSRVWLPFHHYMFDNEQYAYAGRFRYEPTIVTIPDGSRWELMFARERRALPSPVVLDDFVLTPRVGGFTGQAASIRDWTSYVRFADSQGWGDPVSISSNKPAEHKGFWFFQASWDPPQQNSRGFNYTGLGVGNRRGVRAMLASCTLAVIGMCYAFYVKPLLKRRRMLKVHEQVRASQERTSTKVAQELVEVSA